jgi:hypothetical protein
MPYALTARPCARDIDLQALTTSPRLKPEMPDWKIELPVRPMLGTIGVGERSSP